jgi:hypothetical protein
MEEDTQLSLEFPGIRTKSISADFAGGAVTSDGGVLFLRQMERGLGAIGRFVSCLVDNRHQSYVDHSHVDMLRQRVYQIALGYEDCNDSDTLRDDPGLKTACERLPFSDESLASQPTLSRLENIVSRSMLYRMGVAQVDTFIASYRGAPSRIILDIDDTCDPTHGAQQLSLFNGYYDTYCYQPLHIYEGKSGKLILSLLRPGKRPTGAQVVSILKRVVSRIHRAWPHTKILLRGDGHFSTPEVLDFCDEKGLEYVLGLQVRKPLAEVIDMDLLQRSFEVLQEKIRFFTECRYQGSRWKRRRRVIVKAEVSEQGHNLRAIVTNIRGGKAKRLYDRLYCARGQMENFIKNHKTVLHSDRTSCHRFEANQFRLFLHSAAYVLLHALQEHALKGTEYRKAQFDTIQVRLLKIGARVIEKATRIKFHFPTSFPLKHVFAAMQENLAFAFP